MEQKLVETLLKKYGISYEVRKFYKGAVQFKIDGEWCEFVEIQDVANEPDNLRIQSNSTVKRIVNSNIVVGRVTKNTISIYAVREVEDKLYCAIFKEALFEPDLLVGNKSLKFKKNDLIAAKEGIKTEVSTKLKYKCVVIKYTVKNETDHEAERHIQKNNIYETTASIKMNYIKENDEDGKYTIMSKSNYINIQPESDMYAFFENLNYKVWYAISEFVDNSTQSYFDHEKELSRLKEFKGLEVDIKYEGNSFIIRDNAYGMDFENFERAIQLQKPPKDTTGRNEFGMGLKTASFWLGKRLTLESTALGENKLYKLEMDTELLKETKSPLNKYEVFDIDESEHYTKIVIENVKEGRGLSHHATVARVKMQLATIYKLDILGVGREKYGVKIIVQDEELVPAKRDYYEVVEATCEKYDKYLKKSSKENDIIIDPGDKLVKDIEFTINHKGEDLEVRGEIGILEVGSRQNAGLTLYRRGRVIQGGPDKNYRPKEIFRGGGSFEYQRIAGDLHLDKFKVTQQKDEFDWDAELEIKLINKIKERIEDLIYLCKKIDKSDKKPNNDNFDKTDLDELTEKLEKQMGSKNINEVVERQNRQNELEISNEMSKAEKTGKKITNEEAIDIIKSRKLVEFSNKVICFQDYEFTIAKTNVSDFIKIEYKEEDRKKVIVRINFEHDFFNTFEDSDLFREVIAKIALAFAFAETKIAHNIDELRFRNYFNRFIDAFKERL